MQPKSVLPHPPTSIVSSGLPHNPGPFYTDLSVQDGGVGYDSIFPHDNRIARSVRFVNRLFANFPFALFQRKNGYGARTAARKEGADPSAVSDAAGPTDLTSFVVAGVILRTAAMRHKNDIMSPRPPSFKKRRQPFPLIFVSMRRWPFLPLFASSGSNGPLRQ